MLRVRTVSTTIAPGGTTIGKVVYQMTATGRAENIGTTSIKKLVNVRTAAVDEFRGTSGLTKYNTLRSSGTNEFYGTVAVKKLVNVRTAAVDEFNGTSAVAKLAKSIAATATAEMRASAGLTQRYAVRTSSNSEFRGAVNLPTATKNDGIYGNGVYGYPPAYGYFNSVSISTKATSEYPGRTVLRAQAFVRPTGRDEYVGRAQVQPQVALRTKATSEYRGSTAVLIAPKLGTFYGAMESRGVVALRSQVPIRPRTASTAYSGVSRVVPWAVLRSSAGTEYRGSIRLPSLNPFLVQPGRSEYRGTVRVARIFAMRVQAVTMELRGTVQTSYAWSDLSNPTRLPPDLWYAPTAIADPWQTARPAPEK